MRSLPPDHRYWSATTGARLRLPPRRFRLPPEPGVSTPSPGVTVLLQRQLRRDLGDLANHRGTVRRESAGLHPNSDKDPFWRPRRHRPVPSASMSDPHMLARRRPSQPSFGVGVPIGEPHREWLRHLRCEVQPGVISNPLRCARRVSLSDVSLPLLAVAPCHRPHRG